MAININSDEYNNLLSEAEEKYSLKAGRYSLPALPQIWYPLRLYKKKYYVYVPSDGGTNPWVKFTDSTMIQMYPDPGPLPSIVNKVSKLNKITTRIDFTNTIDSRAYLKMHIIDAINRIAVFERPYWPEEFRYTLMIAGTKVKNYPVIINYCKDSKTEEWEFDKPDFSALLKRAMN